MKKNIISKLFEDKVNTNDLSQIEKIPKNILCLVFSYLTPSELAGVWLLNKYFLRLLTDSPFANIIWRQVCKNNFGENFNEIEVDEFVKSKNQSLYEQKLSKFCFFFKHFFNLRWDSSKCGNATKISIDGIFSI